MSLAGNSCDFHNLEGSRARYHNIHSTDEETEGVCSKSHSSQTSESDLKCASYQYSSHVLDLILPLLCQEGRLPGGGGTLGGGISTGWLCVCVFPGFCPAASLPFTMNLRAGGPEMSTKERLRLGSEAREHEGSSYSGSFSIFSSWRWRLCFLPLRAGTAAVP